MRSLSWCFITFFSLALAQNSLTATAPHENPWKSLTIEESSSINTLLQQKLNLTGNSGSSYDSFVYHLATLAPNKTDVVKYFDGNGSLPPRYARATIVTGTEDLAWIEYVVGPLPVSNSTTVELLTFPFNNEQLGKTPISALYSENDGNLFAIDFGTSINNITMKLWNGTIIDGSVGIRIGSPFWLEDGRTITWLTFVGNRTFNIAGVTVLPLGVSAELDITSRNWTDWKATGWYAEGLFYNSTEEFESAVMSGAFKRPDPVFDGPWVSTDRQGDSMPLDNQPPPAPVAKGSPRYQIDEKENFVSWMDFSFYLSISDNSGLGLFDIQYKKNRIMYELSLQEALTAYTGSEPFANQATLFDTEAGFGTSFVSLVKGYDCPEYATYLPATFADGNATKTQQNAICIFEFDEGYPIRRHTVPIDSPYSSVAKNIAFTVRAISAVGNYDFLVEYNFYYDGSIQVGVRASGYISAAYWDGNGEYGFNIHDNLSGSLHDHTMTFKADIDILGESNSVQKIEFMPVSTTYPWSRGRVHSNFKANRTWVTEESSINWCPNDAPMYAIVNKDKPNAFGEFPGYRIKRSSGTIHLTQKETTNIQKAGAYATHDFYLTKHHDNEPRCADPWNQYATLDPLVDFSKHLDGESIEQEDVVVWFNLGMHHIPHTGDLPNTMFTAAHSSMRFEPLNYLLVDPSIQTNQQIRVNYKDDGSVDNTLEFGKIVSNATCG